MLPGYIDVAQTVLVILTMAGLFPDRAHILRSGQKAVPFVIVKKTSMLLSIVAVPLCIPTNNA